MRWERRTPFKARLPSHVSSEHSVGNLSMSLGIAPREIVLPDGDFSMMIVQTLLSKEPPLRFKGKSRLGFYPLLLPEAG